MPAKTIISILILWLCNWCALSWGQPRELWKAEVGAGDNPPVLADGRVYTIGLFAPDGTSTLDAVKEPDVAEVLLCLDAESGDEVWRQIIAQAKVKRGRAYEYEHVVPQLHEGHLYLRGAWGTLACYDANTGDQVWLREADSLNAKTMDHGYQSSPLLHEGLLITTLCIEGQRRDVRLIAFSMADGKEVWKTQLGTAGRGHWSPPSLAKLDGQTQLIVLYNQYLIALNPKDGSEQWRFDASGILKTEPELEPGTFGHTPEDAHPPLIIGDTIMAEYRYQTTKGMICKSEYFAVRMQDDEPTLLCHRPDFINWWDSQAVVCDQVYGIRREPKGRFGSTQARYAYRPKDVHGLLECRSPETGKALWSKHNLLSPDTDHHFEAAVFTISNDRIFIHDEQNLIAGKITPEGYQYLWHTEVKGPAAQPLVSNDRLYLRMAPRGDLICFRLASQDVLLRK
ncbi:MAG: PQQ-binding-like beta-propeller repeat protein [Candidatus Sumerlaeota bacterium]